MTLKVRIPAKLDLKLILGLNTGLWTILIIAGFAAHTLLPRHAPARDTATHMAVHERPRLHGIHRA